MSENQQVNSVLGTSRVLQVVFLVAVVVYAALLWFAGNNGFGLPVQKSVLNLVQFILALISVLSLLLAYYIQKSYSRPRTPQALLTIVIMRAACIEAVAIFGLALGLLGSAWSVTAWFFIASLAGLIFTFPTKERLNELLK
jgi:hypothetical protein